MLACFNLHDFWKCRLLPKIPNTVLTSGVIAILSVGWGWIEDLMGSDSGIVLLHVLTNRVCYPGPALNVCYENRGNSQFPLWQTTIKTTETFVSKWGKQYQTGENKPDWRLAVLVTHCMIATKSFNLLWISFLIYQMRGLYLCISKVPLWVRAMVLERSFISPVRITLI
jgi:hypothetical protein